MPKMIEKTILVRFVPEGLAKNCHSDLTLALSEMNIGEEVFYKDKSLNYFSGYFERLRDGIGYIFKRRSVDGGIMVIRIK